jgi:mRNA-degrading endonuclease RelE of RelBE toxin-antitoxin system
VSYNIVYTPEFEKEIKRLAKKYLSLKKDFQILLEQLNTNPQSGTPIGNNCYKIRLSIASKGKGKSGGARVITHVAIIQQSVILISIYDKSEHATITDSEIKERLKKHLK